VQRSIHRQPARLGAAQLDLAQRKHLGPLEAHLVGEQIEQIERSDVERDVELLALVVEKPHNHRLRIDAIRRIVETLLQRARRLGAPTTQLVEVPTDDAARRHVRIKRTTARRRRRRRRSGSSCSSAERAAAKRVAVRLRVAM
jgi:hypothetical protein